MADRSPYPPIEDYAFIADGNSAALVSRGGSVDWCCIRRIDVGSSFGRLLDREKGGYCSITPSGEDWSSSRRYVDGTLVLETTFEAEGGEARLFDCFTVPTDRKLYPQRQLLRIVEGVVGHVDFEIEISPRFDYGELEPWIRQEGVRLYSAIGGDDGLLISSDAEIERTDGHDLKATIKVRAGERARLSILSVPPERLDSDPPETPGPEELDRRLEDTIEWWREWSSRTKKRHGPEVTRSAIVIKGLTNDLTGAIAAAPTTSLPEAPGGTLNWDYRYSWIRDSYFSVRSLADIGFTSEAAAFRNFIERSAAGSADKTQVIYGVGGERRLGESTLDFLEGYRGAAPVHIGNGAAGQLQLGMYGQLLDLSWRWHRRGNSPDDDYWRFLVDLVDKASELWSEADSGIWEMRDSQQHFVHSKVLCWSALDRGIRLSEECLRRAPTKKWEKTRDEIRETVEKEGYDEERGIFTQAFGSENLDAALLLLPATGFIDYKDERMVRTTDAIREELDEGGLLLRYPASREVGEGAFLACSFWLVECLARQGRTEDANEVFDRAIATANDLDLFPEEYDTKAGEMLGNFPQALTHLSHISAAIALSERHT